MILKTHIHDAMYSTHSIDNTDGTESTDTMDSIYNTDSIDYTDSTDNTNSTDSIHRTDSKDSTYSTEYSGYIIQSTEHTVYTVLYGMYEVLTMYSDRYNVTGGQAPVAAQDLGRQWWTEQNSKRKAKFILFNVAITSSLQLTLKVNVSWGDVLQCLRFIKANSYMSSGGCIADYRRCMT